MTIPAELIQEWKRQFGSIFSVSDKKQEYVLRGLSYKEYTQAVKAESSADVEDIIVATALLYPSDDKSFDRMPAGLVTQLADQVRDFSGFGEPDRPRRVMEEARREVGEVWGMMKAFVLATMPAYKEEELDELNFFQMANKVAISEQILEIRQATYPTVAGNTKVSLDLIDPEEEAEKEKQLAKKHAAQKKPGTAGYYDPIAEKLRNSLR